MNKRPDWLDRKLIISFNKKSLYKGLFMIVLILGVFFIGRVSSPEYYTSSSGSPSLTGAVVGTSLETKDTVKEEIQKKEVEESSKQDITEKSYEEKQTTYSELNEELIDKCYLSLITCKKVVDKCDSVINNLDLNCEDIEKTCVSMDKSPVLRSNIEKDVYQIVIETMTERITETNKAINSMESNLDYCSKYLRVGDDIYAGDFRWRIISFSRKKEIGEYFYDTFMGVKADGEFMILDVEVENIGNSAQYLTDSFIKLVDDKGREFSADTGALYYLNQDSFSVFDTINPGIVKNGKIAFDVPEGLNIVNVKISNNLLDNSFYNIKLII